MGRVERGGKGRGGEEWLGWVGVRDFGEGEGGYGGWVEVEMNAVGWDLGPRSLFSLTLSLSSEAGLRLLDG